jgi:WD40 repeat protein
MREDTIKPQMQRAGSDRPARCLQQRIRELESHWVVTAGPSTAALYEADTGTLVTYLFGHAAQRGEFRSASFSSNGRLILTSSRDGTVRIYRCEICGDLADLIKIAKRRLAGTKRVLTADERKRYLGRGSCAVS